MPATVTVLRSDWEFSAVSLLAQLLPRQLRQLMRTRPPRYIVIRRSPMRAITAIVRLRPTTMRRNPTTVGGLITDKHATEGATTPSVRGLYWGRALYAHHLFRSSRSFRNTVFGSGLSGRSGKASRSRLMTDGLVNR